MNTAEFVKTNKITTTAKRVKSNPNFQDQETPMNHFVVVLQWNGDLMRVPFSQGLGLSGVPTAEDVLDCLASDAASVENAKSFEDWANDFGYDTDSRQAEKTYNICKTQACELETFLGKELYAQLLWSVKRL